MSLTSACRRLGTSLPRAAAASFHTTSLCGSSSYKRRSDVINDVKIRGIDILRDPKISQGTGFDLTERQEMGLMGLLPPRTLTQDEQVYRIMLNFKRAGSDLERFSQMMSLLDRNEKLFFRVVNEYIEEMMPVIYTPTVGLACQKYGLLFARPRGLFITIHDLGHVYDILCNWPNRNVQSIVVTDGERILGLGDLGAYGMGIPVGKLALYTAIAGIPPERCLPVCIDCGTNNESLLDDKLYIGLKQRRDNSAKYVALLDEFMDACVKRFGNDTLIQFEDFGQDNAFFFLDRYINKYLTFNDDIQGTAAVAVAGILASLRITGKQLRDNVFLFQGAGQAATGIAHLLALAMQKQGCTPEESYERIWLLDIDGLVVESRPGSTDYKQALQPFVKKHRHTKDLMEILEVVKPTAIVGASAQRNAFNADILRKMGEINERPVVFALSNPTSKAECTAEDAYKYTEGRAVFASGSPFPEYHMDGKVFRPGQGNNAYIFPAIALAVNRFKGTHITDGMFLRCCELLAEQVTPEDLKDGRVYPPLHDIREVSIHIAVGIGEYMYQHDLARFYPEPKDKERFLRERLYKTDYERLAPKRWDWPDHAGGNYTPRN